VFLWIYWILGYLNQRPENNNRREKNQNQRRYKDPENLDYYDDYEQDFGYNNEKKYQKYPETKVAGEKNNYERKIYEKKPDFYEKKPEFYEKKPENYEKKPDVLYEKKPDVLYEKKPEVLYEKKPEVFYEKKTDYQGNYQNSSKKDSISYFSSENY